MVGDISIAENIYIACDKTDMRKSIDGLAAMVQSQYHLDPFSKSIFLFCGGKSDRDMEESRHRAQQSHNVQLGHLRANSAPTAR